MTAQKPLKLRRPPNTSLPFIFGALGQDLEDFENDENVLNASSPPSLQQSDLISEVQEDDFQVHMSPSSAAAYSLPWKFNNESTTSAWSTSSAPDRSNSPTINNTFRSWGNSDSKRRVPSENMDNTSHVEAHNSHTASPLGKTGRSDAVLAANGPNPFARSARVTRSPPPCTPQTAVAASTSNTLSNENRQPQRSATTTPLKHPQPLREEELHNQQQQQQQRPPVVITGLTPGSTISSSPAPTSPASPTKSHSPPRSATPQPLLILEQEQQSAILDHSIQYSAADTSKITGQLNNIHSSSNIDEVTLLREELRAALNEARRWRDLAESAGTTRAEYTTMENIAETWKNQYDESRQHATHLERHVGKLMNAVFDLRHRAEYASSQLQLFSDRLDEASVKAEEANHQAEEARQKLADEKAKNERAEADFRMFSRRMRSLQDTNAELRQENEHIRSELRRLQYEAATPPRSGRAGDENQLAYDNEALKLLIMELQQENQAFRADKSPEQDVATPTASVLERPYSRHDTRPVSAQSDRYTSPLAGGAGPSSFTNGRRSSRPNAASRPATASTPTPPHAGSGDVSSTSRVARLDDRAPGDGAADAGTLGAREHHAPVSEAAPRRLSNNWLAAAGTRNPITGLPTPSLLAGEARDWARASWSGAPAAGNSPASSANSRPVTPARPGAGVPDFIQMRDELEAELRTLNAHKNSIQYQVARLKGGPGSARKHREELEDQLENVERNIGRVRMKMRNMKII
ncbi:hypothetical protein SeLEV6574_g05742 [Synchytrium endobioticum]|uniref:Enkurin domain-containing protein n=1 Tax=Synchytrium endobioticum TaxID=286115 RepID=A0A507CSV2_9FUNG|nr:hypothetical protein SeLEV6574_g05742 [Synchytrium endobioticum]